MFPHVDAENRARAAVHQRVVLVRATDDRQRFFLARHQPRPTTSEATHCCGGELFLEAIQPAEARVNRLGEIALRFAARSRLRHDLPEEVVVPVPAAVVANRRANFLGGFLHLFDDFFDRHLQPIVHAGKGFVQVIDVGLVVLVVVNRHRLGVDDRFEELVGIRQLGQRKPRRFVLGGAGRGEQSRGRHCHTRNTEKITTGQHITHSGTVSKWGKVTLKHYANPVPEAMEKDGPSIPIRVQTRRKHLRPQPFQTLIEIIRSF